MKGEAAAGKSMRALLIVGLLLAPIASAAPEQVHLGLRDADAAKGFTLSWVDTSASPASTVTLTRPDGVVAIEGRVVPGPTPGVVYEARLPALAPNATYSYAIGERAFPLTPPPAPGEPFRLAFLGDMGVTREAGLAVEAIAAANASLVLHVGDVSYAGGDPMIWKSWFDLVEPVASRVPWIPALGNHEGDVLGAATDEAAVVDPHEQAIFRQRFPQPDDTFWFSFDWAGVHLIALDTFSELTMPSEEIAWLEADLAASKDAAWTIAFFHEPPYSSNAAHGSSPRAHGAFARILEEGGVDLVVTGHDHSYERTYALRDGTVVGKANDTLEGSGTVYVVTGGGGASLYETFVDPQPEWSAAREAAHHILVLDVTPQRIEGRVVATAGSDFTDSFSISRPAPSAAQEEPAMNATPAASLGLWVVALGLLGFAKRRRA